MTPELKEYLKLSAKEMGQNLKTLRLARNMTQMELAEHLGLTFQQVQKYERGKSRISAPILFLICKILNLNPQYFYPKEFETLGLDEPPGVAELNLILNLRKLDEKSRKAAAAFLVTLARAENSLSGEGGMQ